MRLPPQPRHGLAHASTRTPAVLLALILLAPGAARADEDAEPLRPATWDLDPEALVELGLGQSRGVPIPVPDEAPHVRADGAPKAASQGRIFVNFDGAQLSSGWDDSTANSTQIGECAGNFAAYGNGPKRDAVMQAVRDDWAPYNVIITESRPASGNYTMCMTGPSNPFGGGVLGIAPLDCDDSQTPNNIVYAFHSENDGFDASTQATTIGQEVAHSFGLEHVDEPGDIMNPYNAGGDPSFTDQCIGIVGGAACGSQHAAECGSGSSQNSHRELLTLFGTSVPDAQAPTVAITSPADGDTFEVGASFEITVEANDDVAIDRVVLFNNDMEIESDSSSPFGWTVNNAPAGEYVFYVEATDTSANLSTSDTVTITVGAAPADGGGDGGTAASDGGADTGGGSGGADGGADGGAEGTGGAEGAFDDGGDGSLPPGYGLDRADTEGCACAADGPATRWSWTVALLLLGLGRSRRRGRDHLYA